MCNKHLKVILALILNGELFFSFWFLLQLAEDYTGCRTLMTTTVSSNCDNIPAVVTENNFRCYKQSIVGIERCACGFTELIQSMNSNTCVRYNSPPESKRIKQRKEYPHRPPFDPLSLSSVILFKYFPFQMTLLVQLCCT